MDKNKNSYEFRGETLLRVVDGFDVTYESEGYLLERLDSEHEDCCDTFQVRTYRDGRLYVWCEQSPERAFRGLDRALKAKGL